MQLEMHPPKKPIPTEITNAVAAWKKETITQADFYEQAWTAIDTLTISDRDVETLKAVFDQVLSLEEQTPGRRAARPLRVGARMKSPSPACWGGVGGGAFSAQIIRVCALAGLFHGWRQREDVANIPLKVVSERLGHSNLAITADLYTHTVASLEADAAEQLAALCRNASPKADPETAR